MKKLLIASLLVLGVATANASNNKSGDIIVVSNISFSNPITFPIGQIAIDTTNSPDYSYVQMNKSGVIKNGAYKTIIAMSINRLGAYNPLNLKGTGCAINLKNTRELVISGTLTNSGQAINNLKCEQLKF